METIDFDYQNKEFDDIIFRIILNTITSKDLNNYFRKGTLESDKKKNYQTIKRFRKKLYC